MTPTARLILRRRIGEPEPCGESVADQRLKRGPLVGEALAIRFPVSHGAAVATQGVAGRIDRRFDAAERTGGSYYGLTSR